LDRIGATNIAKANAEQGALTKRPASLVRFRTNMLKEIHHDTERAN